MLNKSPAQELALVCGPASPLAQRLFAWLWQQARAANTNEQAASTPVSAALELWRKAHTPAAVLSSADPPDRSRESPITSQPTAHFQQRLQAWRRIWKLPGEKSVSAPHELELLLFVAQSYLALVARVWLLTRIHSQEDDSSTRLASLTTDAERWFSDDACHEWNWRGFELPCFDWWLPLAAAEGRHLLSDSAPNSHGPPKFPWEELITGLRQTVSLYCTGSHAEAPTVDWFRPLAMSVLPAAVRHARGEHYTPRWLAQWVLDRAGYRGASSQRLLDPACGSGTFLMEAISRWKEASPIAGEPPNEPPIAGIDINPLAVFLARANFVAALLRAGVPPRLPSQVPVIWGDSIHLQQFRLVERGSARERETRQLHQSPLELGRFESIAGNPPWVGWESLSPEDRRRTRPLWEHYGLFQARGMNAILGAGRKDLSMLMSYTVSDRLLTDGGRLAFLITSAVFRNQAAGQGFRRFRCGSQGESLKVEQVDDFSAIEPFSGAATQTCVFAWQKGAATQYPLPYRQLISPENAGEWATDQTLAEMQPRMRWRECLAAPTEATQPGASWAIFEPHRRRSLAKAWGRSSYQAREGVNSGGANGVYWLEIVEEVSERLVRIRNRHRAGKKQVPPVETVIEKRFLYPLVRGSQLRRWSAPSDTAILCVQDPITRKGVPLEQLAAEAPRTLSYLEQFKELLMQRAAYRRYFQRRKSTSSAATQAPFYSMFNVGTYTFAKFKVAWHRMRTPLAAAVLHELNERPLLPQETHAFVPTETREEALFLAALLNSACFHELATSISAAGGKSFASPHLLQRIQLPTFAPDNSAHQRLVELARPFDSRHENPADLPLLEELAETLLLG